jgi:hypothetical protein
MAIPKEFKIFGETYKVKQLAKIDKLGSWGEHNPNKNVIKILKSLNDEQKQQTFYHEILHVILYNLKYDELNEDEVFIDRLSKALHQIITTSKYE